MMYSTLRVWLRLLFHVSLIILAFVGGFWMHETITIPEQCHPIIVDTHLLSLS